MKTKFIPLSMVIAFTMLCSFKGNPLFVKKHQGAYQIGYFVVGGQEYDAYADLATTGNVTDVYKTDNNGNDIAAVTINSGTHNGHTINVTFTDVTQKSYHGTCYF